MQANITSVQLIEKGHGQKPGEKPIGPGSYIEVNPSGKPIIPENRVNIKPGISPLPPTEKKNDEWIKMNIRKVTLV